MTDCSYTALVDLRCEILDRFPAKSRFILDKFCLRLKKYGVTRIIALSNKSDLTNISEISCFDEIVEQVEVNKLVNTENTCVYFPVNNLWIDDFFQNMLEQFNLNRDIVFLNKYQQGYAPIFNRNGQYLQQIVNHMQPEAYVSVLSGQTEGITSTLDSYDRFNRYLRADEVEGINALYKLYKRNLKQSDLPRDPDYSSFSVLNRQFLNKQLDKLSSLMDLRGKTILEIGASTTNPIVAKTLIEKYGCKYSGVNISEFQYELEYKNAELIVEDIHQVKFSPGSFDIVFSIAVWEHIADPLPIFDIIESWLKPSGVHYGVFQAWSSRVGHHIFSPRFPAHMVPDYSHLVLSKESFITSLMENGCSEELANSIGSFTFDENEINRVRLKDFVEKIKSGDLEIVFMDGRTNGRLQNSALQAANKTDEYSPEELSCLGLEFLLRKSEFKLLEITN